MTNLSFVKMDQSIINIEDISSIDLSHLESDLKVIVRCKSGENTSPIEHIATNLNAIELLMQIRPSALEGRKLRWAKNKWILHNLVAHPVMQILALFKFYKLAIRVHDDTVPKPIGKKE